MEGRQRRYVFTISPGRSGQASLSALLAASIPDAFVAFEEPQVRPLLPGGFGDMERRFRRRFVETDELLGRGRVLEAFDAGDEQALRRYAAARHRWVTRRLRRRRASVYIDVSKHFLHGLHVGALDLVTAEGAMLSPCIRLVRDPIENMRSYLNRRKRFRLDYGDPNGRFNEVRLDPQTLCEGEFYLHAWCETYLRGERLVRERGLPDPVEIETPDLSKPEVVSKALDRVGLTHGPVPQLPAQNTNIASGYGETEVERKDLDVFRRFRDRLPEPLTSRLPAAFHRASQRAESFRRDGA